MGARASFIIILERLASPSTHNIHYDIFARITHTKNAKYSAVKLRCGLYAWYFLWRSFVAMRVVPYSSNSN